MNKEKTEVKRAKSDTHFFYKGPSYKTCDLYSEKLIDFLFDCRHSITKTLQALKNQKSPGLFLQMFHLDFEGQTVIIYDYFFKESADEGIKINRNDLIKIIKAWQPINKISDIDKVILQRDKKTITLIVKLDNDTEFNKTFNYHWQEEPRPKTGDHYIDTLQAFLYEHRWRPDVMLHILEKEPKIDFGVNTMYMKVESPDVTIYNYFDEHPEQHAIKIKKALLIKLFQAIAKHQAFEMEEIKVKRNGNTMSITIHYDEEDFPDLYETFPL